MDRFSKEVVEAEHCEPCRQVKPGNHMTITVAERKHTIRSTIFHDELVVDIMKKGLKISEKWGVTPLTRMGSDIYACILANFS
jgi:hypothetical protein